MMDCTKRHDEVLEALVERLAKKPGFLFIKQHYLRTTEEQHYSGEMDVMLAKNVDGRQYFRYYEVKGRHTDVGHERAMRQFVRHHEAHADSETPWNYIYVTPTKIERVKFK